MSQALKEFRENSARCIYVTGEIDQETVNRLTPQIHELRRINLDPITVFIDSVGGSIRHANILHGLLKMPDQDGRTCKIVTVVTGNAFSAAADLLARGDYAIAYPHAQIHYHGTRQAAPFDLTTQGASSLAGDLREMNEEFAIRLADHAFPRYFLNFIQLRENFDSIRKTFPEKNLTEVQCLTRALFGKLSGAVEMLPFDASKKQEEIEKLIVFVRDRMDPKFIEESTFLEFDAKILNLILDYKLEHYKGKDWRLAGVGLVEVQEDFVLIFDYHSPKHKQRLNPLITRWKSFFLSQEEKQELEKFTASQEQERQKWIREKVNPKIQPLWYFVVSICRLLQNGEFRLSPVNAYWLGIINEVIGADLVNMRTLVENAPPEKTPQ